MTPEERTQLIDSLIEGIISEADFLRLEAEFSVDPLARKEYYDRLALTASLEIEAESDKQRGIVSLPRVRLRSTWLAVAAIAVGMIAVVAILLPRQPAGGSAVADAPVVEEEASGYAVIAGQANAVWKTTPELADGELVPAGQLELEAGVVQLELFSGVTVIVEGAATFEIESPMAMSVTSGKVRAHVPDAAHGFRIRTERGDIVDLGTEFAVDVTSDRSELHVLDGEVEWHPVADTMRPLKRGEGWAWGADDPGSQTTARATQFIGVAEMQDQLTALRRDRATVWQGFVDDLRNDPRLVALFRAASAEPWSRLLENEATGAASIVGQGAIVAATRSQDRWGYAHGALDFSPTGSRVRLNVPGEYHSITLLCWVKINSLDRWYNSLFLTDGHELHEPHWQIMDDGRLFFSVKRNDFWDPKKGEKDKHIYYSPRFWEPSMSGRWLMIATTYDIEKMRVTHYLNGEVLSRESIPPDYLVETVSIGNASLGNWGLPERDEPRFAVRNLNGSMSDFALFKVALDDREIAEIHAHGKP